jgi:SatD family protein
MNRFFLALTGDVVGSRALSKGQRADVQRYLSQLLDDINQVYGAYFESELAIVGGDGVQALFAIPWFRSSETSDQSGWGTAVAITEVVMGLAVGMAAHPETPMKMIFGIGVGTVSTEILKNQVSAIDGSCFHLAKAALESAKKEQLFLYASGFRPGCRRSAMRVEDQLISGIFILLGAQVAEWTAKQARAVCSKLLLWRYVDPIPAVPIGGESLVPEFTQTFRPGHPQNDSGPKEIPLKTVAQKLKLAESTVSASLKAAQYGAFKSGLASATWSLAWYGSKLRGFMEGRLD